jgi:hypothetical protein
MRAASLDPTGGERAREIRRHPGAPQPVTDPTDARYGKLSPERDERESSGHRIADPTDPLYGQSAV